jgi:hypothetical protein
MDASREDVRKLMIVTVFPRSFLRGVTSVCHHFSGGHDNGWAIPS